jgi:DNA mismatch repair ATPase MutS
VAELAGLPSSVVHRARQLLRDFEALPSAARAARKRVREAPSQLQLSLFGQKEE